MLAIWPRDICRRFTQEYTWAEVHEAYSLTGSAQNLQPRYNIAPTDDIDIVVANDSGEHELRKARLGLVPYWWKKELKELPSTFNARAETVADEPMFRDSFNSKRCIVPASGFYEWTGPKGQNQPWYITAKDSPILSFAGLWARWRDRSTDELLTSATIIVCNANAFMKQLHNRMPVILSGEASEHWPREPDPSLRRPVPEDMLRAWPVNPRVNSSRYEAGDAIEPVAEELG